MSGSDRRLFWLCFAVAMVDGFDTLVVSFIAPAFAAEWSLTGTAVGQIFGAGLVGAALGGVAAGPLADRLGRKRVLLGSVALFALFTLLCAMAPSPTALMALRFAAGLGLGGAIPSITALTAETLPAERRTAAVTRMFLGFPLGAVIGGGLCALMVQPLGWRSAFWLGGALGGALLPLLGAWVRETMPSHTGLVAPSAARLFGERRALSAPALFVGAFLILLVSYFLINWAPSILVRSGMPEQQAILGGVVLNLGGVVGALALTSVIDRLGPFRLVGAALAAGAFAILALGAQLATPLVAAPLLFATGACVIGGQLTLPALAAALFPAGVRATGIGLTMGIGRLGSIIGPAAGGLLVDADLGWGRLFLIIAVPTALAALMVLICGRVRLSGRVPEGEHQVAA